MPKLAGRGTLLAALAVPFVVVVAPLTATADTDPAGAVATEEGAAVVSTSSVAAQNEVGAWYHGTGNVFESEESEEVVDVESEEAASPEVEATSLTPVKTRPAPIEHVVVKDDDDDYEDYYEDDETDEEEVVEDDGVAFAVHEEIEAGAGAEGAWVDATESGAVEVDGDGMSEDTAAWHNNVTAAAGEEGAFVDATSSASGNTDGWHVHGDDGVTFAGYSEHMAVAGEDGAWTSNVESVAVHGHGGHDGHDGATIAGYAEHMSGAGEDGAWSSSVESAAGDLD